MKSIKDKAHEIGWECSKHYDPIACKQEWCEMAARAGANYVLYEIEKLVIYRNIFLFDLDLSIDDFDCKEEKDYFYNDITEKMNSYIKGDVGWNDLCEATYCWSDYDDGGASVACHIKLVEYLQKREVIC